MGSFIRPQENTCIYLCLSPFSVAVTECLKLTYLWRILAYGSGGWDVQKHDATSAQVW
jgi:hypothetical protein